MINNHFETSLEKIGRILARQYDIEVIFEGNIATTDGKKIILPNFDKIPDDLYALLNGYLDHEVGHCKFSKFYKSSDKAFITKFHQILCNGIEDIRIEREMINEFPGCVLNLGPMNKTLSKKIKESWNKIPIAIRLIHGIAEIMKHRKIMHHDSDIIDYLEFVKDDAIALNDCKNTEEIKDATQKIVEKIKLKREEEKEKDNSEGEESEGGESGGSGPPAPSMPGDEKEMEAEGSKNDSKGKKNEEEDGDEGDEGKDAQNGEKSSKSSKSKSSKTGSNSKFDDMLDEKSESEQSKGFESEFDKFVHDSSSLLKEEIEKHIETSPAKLEEEGGDLDFDYNFSNKPHIALTTRYDTVEDCTKNGSNDEYARLINDVKPYIRPIRRHLERVLKIKENSRWISERERGAIDVKTLGRFLADKNFRTPFKEYTKNDVSNVAVELLIDMSGSMHGSKIEVAKKAAIAMGEALKDINIAFEVTGFTVDDCYEMRSLLHEIKDSSRFNRTEEKLCHYVFKRFDQVSLNGICSASAGGNNIDGESIRWAAKRLFDRKEKRKILIVFSDGNPNAYSENSILNGDLKKSVQQIEKSGIEVIGIGIQHSAVDRFYPNNITINNISDLPRLVMSKLSKTLEKGMK